MTDKTANVVKNKGLLKRPSRNPNGRPVGSKNKTSIALKEAILLAAEQTGQDGQGKDGLAGYLKMVAVSDVKAFAGLLGKVLPMQVAGEGGGPIKTLNQIMFMPVGADYGPDKD